MITTLDPSLSVRGKIVVALKADGQLNAIVPAGRVYPGKTPADLVWPFIRVPLFDGVPLEVDGSADGSTQTGVIHCFTKIGPTVPDPEAQAATINAHIVRIVSGLEAIDLGDDIELAAHVTLTQVIPDPAEADAYHGIVSVTALAL